MEDTDSNKALVALLDKISHGEEDSFESFYRAQADIVYRFIRTRLRDPEAAGEILNDVMMDVWRTAGRFEGRSMVQTWLLGITRHKIIDYLRRNGRHKADELDSSIQDEDSPSAIHLTSLFEERELIRRCLDRLTEDHRQVMHLAFFRELPYAEIALVMECPVGTVKTRVLHARRLLKKCLAALGLGEE
jgi:RNA polymerase sigma-70 factor (ECF subfamily)